MQVLAAVCIWVLVGDCMRDPVAAHTRDLAAGCTRDPVADCTRDLAAGCTRVPVIIITVVIGPPENIC